MRILALIWKELLVILFDKRSRIAILVPPIIQLFIFAYAATLDVKHAAIGIINRDSGEQAYELIERFIGSPVIKKIVHLKAMEEVGPFLDQQKGLLVVSFDEQFSRNISQGKPAPVQLLCDGRRSNTTQILAGYLNEIVAQYNASYTAKAKLKQPKSTLVPRTWFNPNILFLWYNIPCLVATLSMIACLVVTSQSIAREREIGTFDQLLISPLSPLEILVGKCIPGILIGLTEGSLMWAIGTWILGVPFTGSAILFLVSLTIFVTSISGIGLFISSLSATQQQALLGTFVFIMPTTLLSGFATPIENMPDWLQPITYAMPLRYMLIISKGAFLKQLPAHIIWMQIWPMVLISIFTLSVAALFFRRRLQ
jgi:ABC-2 type transport system permease protein